ncbi:MAG TPA: murein biosynthesis integral membrane protein MurJ [Thermoanaerobaculia bacterium]|nr:murein biosynthesis integral membrane protein MurJ [Thermoanaerobaculia bacterium]
MNSATTDDGGAGPRRRAFGGYAALVAAGIFLSRVAGLVREAIFARYLGNSAAADAFKFAQKAPNILQNLFGEGVLSASFIPVYARLVARGDEKLAGRVAGVFVSLLALVVSVVVVVGVIITPWVLLVTAPGFEGEVFELTVVLVRILFVSVGILVLSAWCLGVLNTHRMFFLSYVAPVLWNIAAIVTLVIFGGRVANANLAVLLAWGMVIGSVLQFGVQLPFVLRMARGLSLGLDWRLEPVREMFRNFGPVVVGRGVVQVSGYVDLAIATLLPTGAVASLSYAQMIYMLPISLFGMSVAAAELPQMSSQTGSGEEVAAALRKRLHRGLRQIAFFVIPTTVAFLLIGRLLVAALYQRGQFTPADSRTVWFILIGSSAGLLVATLGRLYSSTFYALGDTRTPMRFAIVRVLVGGVLAYSLAIPLRPFVVGMLASAGVPIPDTRWGAVAIGAAGITAASAVAAWVEFLLLRRGIHRRVGAVEPLISYYGKLWISAIAAGAGAVALDRFYFAGIAARLPMSGIVEAGLASGAFGVIYFAVAAILGVPEVKATLSRFRR